MPSPPVMAEPASIRISLVCAWPDRTWQVDLSVPPGSRVRDALAAVDWSTPGAPSDHSRVGVFGRVVTSDHRLSDGDRIEIYRPLLADPKASRRARAAAAGR